MNEAMSKEAHRIFLDELRRCQARYAEEKEAEAVTPATRASLNNVKKLLDNVEGLIDEKGW